MKLSILICTLPYPYRDPYYPAAVLKNLFVQSKNKSVEIIYLGDNKSMTVGRKRNLLMSIAKGEFIAFVDDDDIVSDTYIDKLLEYTELNVDCVGIGVEYYQNGKNKKVYDYSYKKNINHRKNGVAIAGRMPNHLCLWKKEIAQRVQFPDQNLGEDHAWAEAQILKGYSLELRPEIIYYYYFDSLNTQTRRRR